MVSLLFLFCTLLLPPFAYAEANPTTTEPIVTTHVFVRLPTARHPERPRRILVPSPAIQLAPPPAATPPPEDRAFEAEPILPDRRRTPPRPGPRRRLVAEGITPTISPRARFEARGASASGRKSLGERLVDFAKAAMVGTAVAVAFVGGAYLLLVATIAALAWRERRNAPPPPSIVVEFDLHDESDPCPPPRSRSRRQR